MPYLNAAWNTPAAWKTQWDKNRIASALGLDEVERVIDLAMRTPGLDEHRPLLTQVSRYFMDWTYWAKYDKPEELLTIRRNWNRYRAAILQRHSSVLAPTYRAADRIVGDVFRAFLRGVPADRIVYDAEALPLVYSGEGPPNDYVMWSAHANQPIAVSKMPDTALGTVQRWMALPHEVGHALLDAIGDLHAALQMKLADRMRAAVVAGDLVFPAVDVDLTPLGVPHRVRYTPEELAARIWHVWANEAQADLIGLLACGPAFAVEGQHVLDWEPVDAWEAWRDGQAFVDGPESHPTGYLRHQFAIEMLRQLGGHAALVTELEDRMAAVEPPPAEVVFTWYGDTRSAEIVRIPYDQLLVSARLAAEVLVSTSFEPLGNQRYRDVLEFNAADQAIVDAITPRLANGDPLFANEGGTERHALAAAVFAFESKPDRSDMISETFIHFV